jgi:hypothetical protein
LQKHFVIYNSTDVIWCYEDEAFEKITIGWTLHAVTTDEKTADKLCDEAALI